MDPPGVIRIGSTPPGPTEPRKRPAQSKPTKVGPSQEKVSKVGCHQEDLTNSREVVIPIPSIPQLLCPAIFLGAAVSIAMALAEPSFVALAKEGQDELSYFDTVSF